MRLISLLILLCLAMSEKANACNECSSLLLSGSYANGNGTYRNGVHASASGAQSRVYDLPSLYDASKPGGWSDRWISNYSLQGDFAPNPNILISGSIGQQSLILMGEPTQHSHWVGLASQYAIYSYEVDTLGKLDRIALGFDASTDLFDYKNTNSTWINGNNRVLLTSSWHKQWDSAWGHTISLQMGWVSTQRSILLQSPFMMLSAMGHVATSKSRKTIASLGATYQGYAWQLEYSTRKNLYQSLSLTPKVSYNFSSALTLEGQASIPLVQWQRTDNWNNVWSAQLRLSYFL